MIASTHRGRLRDGRVRPLGVVAVLVVAVLLSVLAGGCSGGDDEPGSPLVDDATDGVDGGAETEAVEGLGSDSRPRQREVRLGLTDWTGSRLVVAVAEVIIERRLGYPVTTQPVQRFDDMFADLAGGELDAVLELWPSTLTDTEWADLESGRVADLGPLGVEGRVGWFVPRYVIDDDPELASWEGFTRPGVAARFAVPGTEGRGRLLGIDPSYEQYDEQLVQALGLDFEVVYSGSEDDTRATLEAAVATKSPILLYWWTPTAEILEYDLVKVELPARTAECVDAQAQGRPMSCDYPTEELFKVGSPLLVDSDPELATLLSRLTLSTSDQLAMIHAVEMEGRSIVEVAAEWVDDNESEWSTWLEE